MGWFGRLFSWGADKEDEESRSTPKPAPTPKPTSTVRTPSAYSPALINPATGRIIRDPEPGRTYSNVVEYSPATGRINQTSEGVRDFQHRAQSNLPDYASDATQRALRRFGWRGGQPLGAAPGWRSEGAREEFAPHTYKLPDWQVEQIEQDYGLPAPEHGSGTLRGHRYGIGALQQEDYEALSDKQKQALEFNRMLIDAVQRDKAAGGPVEGADMEAYRSRVQEMFGAQGGSEMYAPNTMALLEGLGMERLRNQDLDEYLSLDRAFTDREVAALQDWDEVPKLKQKGYATSRTAENTQVLDMMQIDLAGEAIEAALAPGNVDSYGWDEQSRIARHLGYTLDSAQTPTGWLVGFEPEEIARLRGGEDSDEFRKEMLYQELYNVLQSRQTEVPDDFWLITEDLRFTDQDYEEIFDYFYLRSLEDDRTGLITDPQYRTGQELRDFIGIG